MSDIRNHVNNLEKFYVVCGTWFSYTNDRNGKIKLLIQEIRLALLTFLYCLVPVEMIVAYRDQTFLATVYFIPTLGVVIIQTLIVRSSQRDLRMIHETFREIFKDIVAEWEVNFMNKYIKLSWRISKTYRWLIVGSMWPYYSSVIIDFCLYLYDPDSKPFGMLTILDSYVGDDIVRTMNRFVVKIVSLLFLTNMALYNISVHTGYFTGICTTAAAIMILNRKIINMKNSKQDQLQYYDIKTVIDLQSKLIRLVKLMRDYFGLLMVVQFGIGSICMCMSIYTSLVARDKGYFMISYFNYLCGFDYILMMFIVCIMGEYLQEKSLSLSYAVYDVKWYELKPVDRKIIWFMQIQSQKVLTMGYKDLFIVNNNLFMQVCQATYSYLMFLTSSRT